VGQISVGDRVRITSAVTLQHRVLSGARTALADRLTFRARNGPRLLSDQALSVTLRCRKYAASMPVNFG
jgi:hypothetical protein